MTISIRLSAASGDVSFSVARLTAPLFAALQVYDETCQQTGDGSLELSTRAGFEAEDERGALGEAPAVALVMLWADGE
jgi:hypothetical protein